MSHDIHFDVLIVVTPDDCKRLLHLYPRLIDNYDYGQIIFVGAPSVEEALRNSDLKISAVKWVNENDIISFDDVHACMQQKMAEIIGNTTLPRGVTGWYYQQFLKMQYSSICEDKYYMVWDGDTLPCRKINMFSKETGQPYLDLKHEYHPEYFDTMGKILPGFGKVIERSFISEHMLFRRDIMQNLISDIESNTSIPGMRFWEKIINSIQPEKIYDSSFSEFETYGTYVALKYTSVYMLRDWHSFRLGAAFFDMNTIKDIDFEWLGKDFDSISFEKGQSVREDHRNLFDNPEYQKKLSAKKMLQLAQMEYHDGYKEVWMDDVQNTKDANVTVGGFYKNNGNDNKTIIVIVSYNSKHLMQENIKSIRDVLTSGTYKIVVVDNASTDGVSDYLSKQKDIIYIRNTENIGFGPACNIGVRARYGSDFADADIFLLNNDTRLVFDALYFLKQALYSSDDIGAVGSVSNYAGNKQQIDVEFDTVEEYIRYGEKVNVPMANSCLERVRLSGFAMLIRRKVWDEIGGFDEDFVPGYFEDDALSMEILKRGYRLKVVRNSFIYHAGSQSFIKTDYNNILDKNHELFIQKYGFDILKYAYASGTVISQIPFREDERFSVLHFGCGLGAEIKAIKSLYSNCITTGVETNSKLYDIVRKTENVFESLDELLEFSDDSTYDVLIIDKDVAESLDDAEQGIILSLLAKEPVILIKNQNYEEFQYDKIKLIIWDMDDTFWQGILSEGEVILPVSNADLISNITDHGVVNSISSKNDEEPVMDELALAGIADLFVFNDINWEDKGPQIAAKIKAMGLRPENCLFIDDNPRNLEEARFYSPGIMTAAPDIIPYLNTFFNRTDAKDSARSRLAQYKLLEKKTSAIIQSASKEEFLNDSNIKIAINKNCLDQIDRITELVGRSNQLNYTKNRDDKRKLTRLVTNDWNNCGYVSCHDKYGDYGIIGFFCYNEREKRMEHFLFSCRVLGMGIEQYVYNKLGCPDFEVKEPVSVRLLKEDNVTWITEDIEHEVEEDTGKKGRIKILLKGPCDLDSVEPYITGGNITSEFNYVNEKGFITTGQNHSMHIWESAHMSNDEIAEMIKDVPFITLDDFETKLFEEEYNVICFSMLSDLSGALYRNKESGKYLSFASKNHNLTDNEMAHKFISGEIQNHGFSFTEDIIKRFADKWEYIGITPIDLLFRNLDYIYDNVKGKPIIILLLGSEIDCDHNIEEFDDLVDIYRAYNPMIQEFVNDHERMRTVNVTDFIHSQDDFGDCINHFGRNVYYKLAGEICKYINELV